MPVTSCMTARNSKETTALVIHAKAECIMSEKKLSMTSTQIRLIIVVTHCKSLTTIMHTKLTLRILTRTDLVDSDYSYISLTCIYSCIFCPFPFWGVWYMHMLKPVWTRANYSRATRKIWIMMSISSGHSKKYYLFSWTDNYANRFNIHG